LSVSIDKTLYEREAVLKAAHRFTDRYNVILDAHDSEFVISFKPKADADLTYVVDNFRNELIDEQVRCIVQKECGEIRDQIVKKAFSPIQ
jgi:His-Xaa-Ser system protein HxsD